MPPRTAHRSRSPAAPSAPQRRRVTLQGVVQGVGFRPLLFRLAQELRVGGWVSNTAQGLVLEVEGAPDTLDIFAKRLQEEKPPAATLRTLESRIIPAEGSRQFEIRGSLPGGEKAAAVLPDLALCGECRREMEDPADRRYRYPFINCTQCGPRFSIQTAIPYDRPNTTMQNFWMCPACRMEYEDPQNRRFHAQPIACPVCGPHLECWDTDGRVLAVFEDALTMAARAIQWGAIVAVKGVGGFHLMVDARNEEAVQRLRRRKGREEKPFALLFPDLNSVRSAAHVSPLEESLLTSPAAPIVLLRKRLDTQSSGLGLAHAVAPGNPLWGAFLPSNPLHVLLMGKVQGPVVATSGNRSEEPICTEEYEALDRLRDIAEVFLVHNRPIARHVDDSVVRVVMDRELVLRRARGYAPLPVFTGERAPAVLSMGAHLKNTIAVSVGEDVFVSQHIGDLGSVEASEALGQVTRHFQELYTLVPDVVACDMHPDYVSTRCAGAFGVPVLPVQHHHAHVLSCMAEHRVASPVLGVSWDGTGYGLDGSLWGGEFLKVTDKGFGRIGHLRTFRLPGGEAAIREPRRSALGVLYELWGDSALDQEDLLPVRTFRREDRELLATMLRRTLHSPLTSSMGRLFDAVAALVGVRQECAFEGQAAMGLEFALDGFETEETYPFGLWQGGQPKEGEDPQPTVVDWGPMVIGLLTDMRRRTPVGLLSAKFHNTLAEMILSLARLVGEKRVVLSGGCFQNKYLTERAVRRLRDAGFEPYWHQQIPPNDGGIALGQAAAAAQKGERGVYVPSHPW